MTRATVDDVHEIARGMPGATITADARVYQVSSRSFVFFRTPRPGSPSAICDETRHSRR